MPSRLRESVGGIVVVVVLASCVHQGASGVRVRSVDANLVFGVKPPPATPPPAFGPGAAPGAADTGALANADVVPDFPPSASGDELGRGFTFKPRPPLSPQGTCPPAALNAFPAELAGDNVNRQAQDGQYRWKRGGSFSLATAPGTTFPYGGFEERLVRNARSTKAPDGSTTYTFDTVQPNFSGNTVVSSWQVKTNGVSTTPRQLTVNGPNAGDPERGLVLKTLTTLDKDGHTVAKHSFAPGVLYLPLPTGPGLSWQAAGVDPTTGETLSISGAVKGHERVDACGDIVDGWRVTATETFSGADSRSVTYNYIVATQLGGLLINEQSDTTTADGHYKLEYTLGQLHPDPLPSGG